MRGGRMKLKTEHLKYLPLIVMSVLIIKIISPNRTLNFFIMVIGVMFYFIFCFFMWKREKKIFKVMSFFMMICLIGGTFNLIALSTNGLRMPVLLTNESKGDYNFTDTHFGFYEKEEINNYFFVDRFETVIGIASIGDGIIAIGLLPFLFITFYGLISRKLERELEEETKHLNTLET